MKTLGGDAPSISSLCISGTLLRNWLTLTSMGQRAFPQRSLDPLQAMHWLLREARVVILRLSSYSKPADWLELFRISATHELAEVLFDRVWRMINPHKLNV
ncbi:MAG: hypothetical protein QHH24_02980 [Candidatus Bathyarchaeota archaeon]|nr:hypothetical protein [Candidatus Bathyarchaeota archaeon]